MAKKKKPFTPGRDGHKLIDIHEPEDPAAGGEMVQRQRAVGHDTLRLLHIRGTLDQYHIRAGLRYLVDFEKATIGAAGSADLMKVSGSPRRDLSYVQLDAIEGLKRAHGALGVLNSLIIRLICVENLTIPQLGERFAAPPYRWPAQHYAGVRTREAFEALAKWYFTQDAINTD